MHIYTHIYTYTYRCRYRYWFRYRFIASFFFCFTQKGIWTWDGKISQTLYWFQNNKKDTLGAVGVSCSLLFLMSLQLLPSWAMAVCWLCSQTTMHSSTFNSEILQSHRTFLYIHCDQHFELPKHHSAWADTLTITLFGLLDFFMLLESFQKQGRPRIILERTFIRMPTMPTFQMPASWSITSRQLTYVLQHVNEVLTQFPGGRWGAVVCKTRGLWPG